MQSFWVIHPILKLSGFLFLLRVHLLFHFKFSNLLPWLLFNFDLFELLVFHQQHHLNLNSII